MFRILLINPPRAHLVKLDTPSNVDLGEISAFPPIGLMYLAQALRKKSGDFAVQILDAVPPGLSYSQIADKALKFKPDIIGITTFTFTFYDVLHTAITLKEVLPDVPIAVGGPHLYLFANETMRHDCFDYAIVGDGEEVFTELCCSLKGGRMVSNMQGLYSREGGQIKGSGAAFLKDLDTIPVPSVDLIDPLLYYSTIGKKAAVGTICTSRGCPFSCTFCQVPKRKYLIRSLDNIVDEIKEYTKNGVTDFFFFDDLFNVTKARVIEFSERLLREDMKIGWMFRGRVDQIDNNMLKMARRAGCHTISVGVEDSTNEGLKAIKKNITIEQAFEAVGLIRKSGIRCSTNWIIGFPRHKTPSDLKQLLDTAIKMDADYALFSVLQCMPGSELYEQAVSEGGLDKEAWAGYVLNPSRDFHSPIWERHMTKEQLFEFYEYAFRRYYFRPRVILREALRINSFAEAANKARSFARVFMYAGDNKN